jgi:hypothetical protein
MTLTSSSSAAPIISRARLSTAAEVAIAALVMSALFYVLDDD